jgi:hypothetical protein
MSYGRGSTLISYCLPEEAEGSDWWRFENEKTSSPAEMITGLQNASCNAMLSLLSKLLVS